jgi:membrane protease YdiL (CAAX protease family)
MALGGVVAITLLLFVPLLAVGEAPLLVLIKKDFAFSADVLEGARDSASLLRGETYSLTWNLLAATLAVGFGVRRNWRECLERLGLVRLSPRQIGLALGLTALVFVLSEGVDFVANHFWSLYAWPTTEGKAFYDMFKALSSPVGAIVIGVTAGLGEEVLVRGMLQPRLGILLSNLFFTALHAYQYNWDSLLWMFVFGLALGLIRKRTSTSVCAIVHGGFDFVVIMIGLLTE